MVFPERFSLLVRFQYGEQSQHSDLHKHLIFMKTSKTMTVAEFFVAVPSKLTFGILNMNQYIPCVFRDILNEKIAELDKAIENCKDVIQLIEVAEKHSFPVSKGNLFNWTGYELSGESLKIGTEWGNVSMSNYDEKLSPKENYESLANVYTLAKDSLVARLNYITTTPII